MMKITNFLDESDTLLGYYPIAMGIHVEARSWSLNYARLIEFSMITSPIYPGTQNAPHGQS